MPYGDRITALMTYPPLGTLKAVAPDLWVVDGPLIRFMGLPFPTRMTIVRLANGTLWVHSPTGNDAALMQAVAELGPVSALVAPNWVHYAWMPAWQAAFPAARTWVAPGVAKRAASKGVSLRVDAELAESDPWAPELVTRIVQGSALHQEAVFFHATTRTLIVTDLIVNFERAKSPGWLCPLLGAMGMLDPDGRAPLELRWSFLLGDKDAARASLREIIGWAPERVLLAHGRWYDRDGTEALRRSFRWLGVEDT